MTAECAIYGGIAAGGQSAGRGLWPVAVITIASVALAEMVGACYPVRGAGQTGVGTVSTGHIGAAQASGGGVPGGDKLVGSGSAVSRSVDSGHCDPESRGRAWLSAGEANGTSGGYGDARPALAREPMWGELGALWIKVSRRLPGRLLGVPAGARVLLVLAVLWIAGPKDALLALPVFEAAWVGCVLALASWHAGADRATKAGRGAGAVRVGGAVRASGAERGAGTAASAAAGAVAGAGGAPIAGSAYAADAARTAGSVAAAEVMAAATGTLVGGWSDPGIVLACRDDGPVARWAGRLVQGNLIPLPRPSPACSPPRCWPHSACAACPRSSR